MQDTRPWFRAAVSLIVTAALLVACDRIVTPTAPAPPVTQGGTRIPVPLGFAVLRGVLADQPAARDASSVSIQPLSNGVALLADRHGARRSDIEETTNTVGVGWTMVKIDKSFVSAFDLISTSAGTTAVAYSMPVSAESDELILRGGMEPILTSASCSFIHKCNWDPHVYHTSCQSIVTTAQVETTHKVYASLTPSSANSSLEKKCGPPASEFCPSNEEDFAVIDAPPPECTGDGGGSDAGTIDPGQVTDNSAHCEEYVVEVSWDDGATWEEVDRFEVCE